MGNFANSSETRLAIVQESTWGVTPATPAFLNCLITGESLGASRQTISSNSIRPDRNVQDLTQVGGAAAGDINIEMVYGGTGSPLDLLLEGVMFSAWSSDAITNGVTEKSFTIEKTFPANGSNIFYRLTGMVPNTFNLNCTAGSEVTGSFGFMGKDGSTSASAISGATYTPVGNTTVMNAASGFAGLGITGLTSPNVRTLNLSVTNNLRDQKALGHMGNVGVGTGDFVLTGGCEVYLEDRSLIEMYLAGTPSDLTFTLGTVSGSKYTFTLPNLRWTEAQVVAGGKSQDVVVSAKFQGIYDSTEGATFKIERAVA
jgi:hypothetical protein